MAAISRYGFIIMPAIMYSSADDDDYVDWQARESRAGKSELHGWLPGCLARSGATFPTYTAAQPFFEGIKLLKATHDCPDPEPKHEYLWACGCVRPCVRMYLCPFVPVSVCLSVLRSQQQPEQQVPHGCRWAGGNHPASAALRLPSAWFCISNYFRVQCGR